MKPWEVEEKWYFELSTRVFQVLAEREISLYRLSVMSGVSPHQTDRYLRKGRRMPAYALFRYAQVLGVKVSHLVGDLAEHPVQQAFDFNE